MERLTQRVNDGILVKESHGENAMKTLYQCFGDKPNENYSNCEEGYCAMEKLADYEDAEEKGSYSKWIPVSERLPEDCIDVLVYFEYYRYGNYNRLFQTMGISYTYNGEWSGFVNGQSGWNQLRIIAWMPLPEPYRESEVEK